MLCVFCVISWNCVISAYQIPNQISSWYQPKCFYFQLLLCDSKMTHDSCHYFLVRLATTLYNFNDQPDTDACLLNNSISGARNKCNYLKMLAELSFVIGHVSFKTIWFFSAFCLYCRYLINVAFCFITTTKYSSFFIINEPIWRSLPVSLWEEKWPIPLGEVNHRPHQRVLVKRNKSIIDENRVRGVKSGLDIRERWATVKAG